MILKKAEILIFDDDKIIYQKVKNLKVKISVNHENCFFKWKNKDTFCRITGFQIKTQEGDIFASRRFAKPIFAPAGYTIGINLITEYNQ